MAAPPYSISVKDFVKDGESSQRLIIRTRTRTILDQTAHDFAVVDSFSASSNEGLEHARLLTNDLTGDGKQSLMIRIWNGGAHCCYSYDVYSVSDNFKRIWHFDARDGHMLTARRNKKSMPTLYIEDATFRYWGVGLPAMPVVALKWNGRTFVPVHEKGAPTLDDEKEKSACIKSLKSLKPDQQQELYECIVRLYFCGNAQTAMQYLKKAEGADYDSLHTDYVQRLKTSPFYNYVSAINKGVL